MDMFFLETFKYLLVAPPTVFKGVQYKLLVAPPTVFNGVQYKLLVAPPDSFKTGSIQIIGISPEKECV